MIHMTTFFFILILYSSFCCSWYLAESHENNTKTHRGNSNQIGFSNLHRLGTATPKANRHIETANVRKDTAVADSDTKPQYFPQTVRNSRICIYHTQNHHITQNWHLQNGPSVGHDDLEITNGHQNFSCYYQSLDSPLAKKIVPHPAASQNPDVLASRQIPYDLLPP